MSHMCSSPDDLGMDTDRKDMHMDTTGHTFDGNGHTNPAADCRCNIDPYAVSTIEVALRRDIPAARDLLRDLACTLAGLNTFADGNARDIERAIAVLENEIDAREASWTEADRVARDADNEGA